MFKPLNWLMFVAKEPGVIPPFFAIHFIGDICVTQNKKILITTVMIISFFEK